MSNTLSGLTDYVAPVRRRRLRLHDALRQRHAQARRRASAPPPTTASSRATRAASTSTTAPTARWSTSARSTSRPTPLDVDEGRADDRAAARQLLPEHRQHLRLELARDRDPDRPQRRARRGLRVDRQRGRHRRRASRCSATEAGADRGRGDEHGRRRRAARSAAAARCRRSTARSRRTSSSRRRTRRSPTARSTRPAASRVEARDSSAIDATVHMATSSGDLAVSIALAFNTIGWASQNFLFNAIDAILGDSLISSALYPNAQAETFAWISNTDDHRRRRPQRSRPTARSRSTRRSRTRPTRTASALYGANGKAVGGIIAMNKVRSAVHGVRSRTAPSTVDRRGRRHAPSTRPGSSPT